MLPALAHADDSGPLVDAVIVTAHPDPEDPPVVADARRRLSQTPGAAAVISAEAYRDRYAQGLAETLRDVLGVYAQKKWGDDTRLSIRGSGIGNPNHNRGTLLAQDGVPFNEADGYGDFQQIDPLLARFTEVYKGANALRFGGALLGAAINMVTPTGKDAGAARTGSASSSRPATWPTSAMSRTSAPSPTRRRRASPRRCSSPAKAARCSEA